jgi:hypothetical protein
MTLRLSALAFACTLALPALVAAGDFSLLTVGKVASFKNAGDAARNGGVVRIGRDPNLRTPIDPRCPTVTSAQILSYPQALQRVATNLDVALDCSKWRAKGKGYDYTDPSGTVKKIHYGPDGARIVVRGADFTPIAGPVGYLEANLVVGGTPLRARFHVFARNDATKIVTRRPSPAAAAGEAGFWDTIVGLDDSEAHQQETIALLQKASKNDRRDGRSPFLLGMIHLYRFGQMITDYASVSDTAEAELVASNQWFAKALPLLWDGQHGDSRVPGFVAAGEYVLGVVQDDAALRAKGLAGLATAVQVNAFFNVFDYVTVIQVARAGTPEFQQAFEAVSAYLSDPATLACVVSQPELCANEGFAAHNLSGSLLLFGDVYAKAGDVAQATQWYTLASGLTDASYPFSALVQSRVANVAARVAAYQDDDPSNDPPVVGLGAENCAVCHIR